MFGLVVCECMCESVYKYDVYVKYALQSTMFELSLGFFSSSNMEREC